MLCFEVANRLRIDLFKINKHYSIWTLQISLLLLQPKYSSMDIFAFFTKSQFSFCFSQESELTSKQQLFTGWFLKC
ncbi:unnamed protein product [Paramecium octaurelia]|uniref:Uncharacterized protein n=1 Tax=Paramecium octaurelia TaxID=43137 RepID=A0A8S1XJI3_PAROT|nr:unnamed protein product [Paramecium octaurelia]